MDESKKCRWTSNDGEEFECDHVATHDDGAHCIFHANNKDRDEFKQAIRSIVRKWMADREEEWDFSGFVFPSQILASDITPENDTRGYPYFPKDVNLFSATFYGQAGFREAIFGKTVFFEYAIFKNHANFISADFRKEVYFASAIFKDRASFSYAIFNKSANFNSVVFEDSVEYDCIKVVGNTDYSSSKFCSDALFSESSFSNVDFRNCEFRKKLQIERSECKGETLFSGCAFYDSVSLNLTYFSVIGDFKDIRIADYVKWTWPGKGRYRDKTGHFIYRGQISFDNVQFEEGGILDLTGNSLQGDSGLSISNCRMKHILLEGTDCTQIGFYNNTWPESEDRIASLFGRKVGRDTVGDEYQIGGLKEAYDFESGELKDYNPNPALIRRTYQQLARRFREDLDHPRANEFDRGSFEMRRLEAIQEMKGKDCEKRLWRGLSTYIGLFIYKNVSHYSGSLVMPLYLWLMITIAGAFLYSAMTGGGLVDSIGEININYMWQMFCLSFKSAISIVRTDVEAFNIQPSWGIVTLAATQKLLSGVLLTLFIFAIRRRFKH